MKRCEHPEWDEQFEWCGRCHDEIVQEGDQVIIAYEKMVGFTFPDKPWPPQRRAFRAAQIHFVAKAVRVCLDRATALTALHDQSNDAARRAQLMTAYTELLWCAEEIEKLAKRRDPR